MLWDGLKLDGGAGNRNRTYDLIITNDALYQLSYSGEGAEYSGGACDAQGSWHHQQPAALDSGALDPRRPVESSVRLPQGSPCCAC